MLVTNQQHYIVSFTIVFCNELSLGRGTKGGTPKRLRTTALTKGETLL